jgi:hypothetical protein
MEVSMTKACINHNGVPATAMCFQCHKPVCGRCLVKTDAGSFCCDNCALQYQTFKERFHKPTGSRISPGSVIAGLVGLAAVALGLIYVMNNILGMKILPGLDIIGKLLK